MNADDLLQRCARGEPEAARELVRTYQAVVLRFLSRMLGAHDPVIDDVAQLTFVAALRGASRFDGRSQVRTWLLGIAHNQVRMEIRSRTRRRRAMGALSVLRLVAPPAAPLRPDHELADLRDALDALDPQHRGAFVLCDLEGLTSVEAGVALAAPAGTVRRWRSEARTQLRAALADHALGGT